MNWVPIGETALAISVAFERTVDCAHVIRKLAAALQELRWPGIVSVRCGLDSLLIEHAENFDREELLAQLPPAIKGERLETDGDLLRVPVCYESDFGRDLTTISQKAGMSPEEVVAEHCAQTYEVWMIGFMPGFPYMGGLPESMQMERKKTPDPSIPAGSVAIAEEYVGIYPFDSPGGWHILGRTPWVIIDYARPKPWLFDYGMRVQFYSITIAEFEKMRVV